MTIKSRPKSDYQHQATWDSLFVITEHWESEMNFYEDELRFLKDVLDKYFIWLIKDEHLKQVQALVTKLKITEIDHHVISGRIEKHLLHLSLLVEKIDTKSEVSFRHEHEDLEVRFTEFSKEFKALKKEVFTITKSLLAEEKLKHLITS